MASQLTLDVLPDGRVLGQIAVVPMGIPAGQQRTQEMPLFSIDRVHWRSCLDVFLNNNGNTLVDNALVRVYAATKASSGPAARVEVARGRVGVGPSIHEVIRLRGEGCDTYDVTITTDFISIDQPMNPKNLVTVSFCAWGTSPATDTDPVTRKDAESGFFAKQLAKTSARLFSANASNPNNTDLWLQIFDTYAIPADGTRPTLPPVYMPAGSKGVAAIAFDRRPFECIAGLYWAASTSPLELITPTLPQFPYVEVEFL